jgi:hypothetical protein
LHVFLGLVSKCKDDSIDSLTEGISFATSGESATTASWTLEMNWPFDTSLTKSQLDVRNASDAQGWIAYEFGEGFSQRAGQFLMSLLVLSYK